MVTGAYAVWCASYVPAFIAGLLSPWAFPTALFLWYLLGSSHAIISLPPEVFGLFILLSLAYGLLGLLATKISRALK